MAFVKKIMDILLYAILNRCRDYFSDLLNPVDATPIQIREEQVGEDIQITEADANAVIKSLKTG